MYTSLRKVPHLNCPPGTVLTQPFWFTIFVDDKTSDIYFEIFTIPQFYKLKGRGQLELQIIKMSVSSADLSTPRGELQILLTTLRITTRRPIPSYSKASGVFPSWCG